MNQSEIMTLINSGVDEKLVRNAIVAGKLSTVMATADRDINRASYFNEDADWEQILKFMQGTLKEAKRHRMDEF